MVGNNPQLWYPLLELTAPVGACGVGDDNQKRPALSPSQYINHRGLLDDLTYLWAVLDK